MLKRLVLPLALLTPLALASPAAALDWRVDVVDFEFKPRERQIAVGDSVTWTFSAAGHTATAARGQPDYWNSMSAGTNAQGSVYSRVFNTPGRYQYVCTPHSRFMKGVIQVGTDTVVKSVRSFKTKRSGKRVRLTFVLAEPAKVTYRLKGPVRRTVKRGRLRAGKHGITLRRLKRGTYRGALTVVDDFDKKQTPRNFFVIR